MNKVMDMEKDFWNTYFMKRVKIKSSGETGTIIDITSVDGIFIVELDYPNKDDIYPLRDCREEELIMLKVMKLIKATAIGDKTLELVYEDGVKRTFDISPYIKGSWMGELANPEYFRQVKIEPEFRETVIWPNGQAIASHELFDYSVVCDMEEI